MPPRMGSWQPERLRYKAALQRWKDANATIGTAVANDGKTPTRRSEPRLQRRKDANATIGTAVANDGKTPTRRSEPRLQTMERRQRDDRNRGYKDGKTPRISRTTSMNPVVSVIPGVQASPRSIKL